MPGDDVRDLLESYLATDAAGWSMGTRGAIAEFVRTSDEPVERASGTAVTGRGGLALDLPDGVRLLAHETPAGPHGHWNHAVLLCLPAEAARCAVRTVVTELGPDTDALRPGDKNATVVDLGLGTPTVDVCVRTDDADLLAVLRAGEGTVLFENNQLLHAVVRAGPHRVFRTAVGRVEVYTEIPAPEGRSPDGPHTHVLPKLLRTGRTHLSTVPVRAGFLPCAALYPPHPAVGRGGEPREFARADHHAFQELLARFGDPHQRELKADTWHAARTGGVLPAPTDPPGRAAVAVALRQLARLEPTLSTPSEGRELPAELLDPDGDPNAE